MRIDNRYLCFGNYNNISLVLLHFLAPPSPAEGYLRPRCGEQQCEGGRRVSAHPPRHLGTGDRSTEDAALVSTHGFPRRSESDLEENLNVLDVCGGCAWAWGGCSHGCLVTGALNESSR